MRLRETYDPEEFRKLLNGLINLEYLKIEFNNVKN